MENTQDNSEIVQENQENLLNEQPAEDKKQDVPSDETQNDNELPLAAEKSEEEKASSDDNELPLPEGDESADKKKEIPAWMKKKIDRERRQAALLHAENEKLRQAIQGGQPQPHTQSEQYNSVEAPRREEFGNEHEYIAAVVRHENQKAAVRFQDERRNRQMVEAELEFQGKLKDTLERGTDKYEDFEEKTAILFSADFPTNRAMGEAIVNSPHKDDILYFLGTYPKEAIRIANMNPVKAIEEVTRLSLRFEGRQKNSSTKAAAPIESVASGRSKTESVTNMQDLARIAASDDQRAFEDAVKKLAQRRSAF